MATKLEYVKNIVWKYIENNKELNSDGRFFRGAYMVDYKLFGRTYNLFYVIEHRPEDDVVILDILGFYSSTNKQISFTSEMGEEYMMNEIATATVEIITFTTNKLIQETFGA